MDEHHDHPQTIRYTIHLTDRHWWGGRVVRVIEGNESSIKDGELLIKQPHGFTCVNFARVRWMDAELLSQEH